MGGGKKIAYRKSSVGLLVLTVLIAAEIFHVILGTDLLLLPPSSGRISQVDILGLEIVHFNIYKSHCKDI